MAKGQVTEEELTKGLQSMGSMSALSSGKPKRDNPFRDTREPEPRQEPVTPERTSIAAPVKEQKQSAQKVERTHVQAIKPRIQTRTATFQVQPEIVGNTLLSRSIEQPEADEEELLNGAATKAEVYPERVTVPLSSEMKVHLDLLAKEMQRIRPAKRERITANTLVRVAITVFLESFQATPISSEEELLEVVRMRLGIRK